MNEEARRRHALHSQEAFILYDVREDVRRLRKDLRVCAYLLREHGAVKSQRLAVQALLMELAELERRVERARHNVRRSRRLARKGPGGKHGG